MGASDGSLDSNVALDNDSYTTPPPIPEPEFKLEYPADKPVVITQPYGRNPQWYLPFGLKG